MEIKKINLFEIIIYVWLFSLTLFMVYQLYLNEVIINTLLLHNDMLLDIIKGIN